MGIDFATRRDFDRMAEAVRRVERMVRDFTLNDQGYATDYAVRIVRVTVAATTGRGKYTGAMVKGEGESLIKFYNLAETQGGTVLLEVGQYVRVNQVHQKGLDALLTAPSVEGERWAAATTSTGGSTIFPCRITSVGSADSSDRYPHTFVEVELNAAGGYDGWQTMAGGRSGTAYNMWENNNINNGIHGSGFNEASYPTGWSTQPVATNLVTFCLETTQSDGPTEYWLIGPQYPDGTCPTKTNETYISESKTHQEIMGPSGWNN